MQTMPYQASTMSSHLNLPYPVQHSDEVREISSEEGVAVEYPSVVVEPASTKLFVGGCPAGIDDEALRKQLRDLFEPHGTVEDVFVMRGGSRSGMACAFVLFATHEMAQCGLDAVHGKKLPSVSTMEPLAVRWADRSPRKRDGRTRDGRGRRQNMIPMHMSYPMYPNMMPHMMSQQGMMYPMPMMPMGQHYYGMMSPQGGGAPAHQMMQQQQAAMMQQYYANSQGNAPMQQQSWV